MAGTDWFGAVFAGAVIPFGGESSLTTWFPSVPGGASLPLPSTPLLFFLFGEYRGDGSTVCSASGSSAAASW
eukprot:8994091-Heterocapsa_arctica.AAC.1